MLRRVSIESEVEDTRSEVENTEEEHTEKYAERAREGGGDAKSEQRALGAESEHRTLGRAESKRRRYDL